MMTYINLRITGTEEECAAFAAQLSEKFDVVKVSGFYLNSGKSKEGRVYVEVCIDKK